MEPGGIEPPCRNSPLEASTRVADDLHSVRSHPRKVRGLGEAIISRLIGGMVAVLEAPDRETLQRIAVSIAARHGLTLDESAAAFIASGGVHGAHATNLSSSPSNSRGGAPAQTAKLASAREMEGLIIKVDAVRRLLGGLAGFGGFGGPNAGSRIGLAGVQRALDVAAGRTPPASPNMQREAADRSGPGIKPPLRFHQILSAVCQAAGVSQDQVLAKGRPAPVVLARSVCVFIARKLTKMSYPEIASHLARPNHSTVITAFQRISRAILTGETAILASGARSSGELNDDTAAAGLGGDANQPLTVKVFIERLTYELGR